MARSKAGTFEQFKINGQTVPVGSLLSYELGKKTRSFGTYLGTPGPANISVIDANGRNEGKPMYVNQWKVLGFYAPAVSTDVEAPTATQESTGGGEMIKYHRFLAPAFEVDVEVPVGDYVNFDGCMDADVTEFGKFVPKKRGRK